MLFSGVFRRELVKEANAWVAEGLVTQEQAEQIGLRYGADVNNPDQSSIAYRVLVTLGYLFIGLALIVLIGANWDEIPRFVRMAGLIALTVGTQLFGVYKISRDQKPSGVGWIFLGNLFFGASIILIAQIYHLGEHMPDGIHWWALGCLPFALLLKSRLLMLQSLALSTLWFGLELTMGNYLWWYIVFVAASFYVLWCSPASGFYALVCFAAAAFWLLATVVHVFDSGSEFLIAVVLYLLVVEVLCQWWKYRGGKLLAVGDYISATVLISSLLLLLVLSFEGFWRGLLPMRLSFPGASIAVIVAVCVACMVACVAMRRLNPCFYISLFLLVALVLLVLTDQSLVGKVPEVFGNKVRLVTVLKTVSGVLLFLSGILLVQYGISHLSAFQFYLGIIAILTSAWARYFDLVGDYIGGAILFIVCALVLLVAARYWKSRNISARQAV